MRIIGINGSPNRQGNTCKLLEVLISYCMEKSKSHIEGEILNAVDYVEGLEPLFCSGCSTLCRGECIREHKIKEAFNKISEADCIVVGSPVYFGTIAAPLKLFFDKSRYLRLQKKLINKIGVGVTVGASKYGGQETTIRAIHDIMLVHGMIIIGDGHANYDAGHFGICANSPSLEDSFALKRIKVTAERMLELSYLSEQMRKL